MHKELICLIFLFLINSYYCSYYDCEEEEDQSKCSEHDIEYEGLSCYKITNLNNLDKTNEIERYCFPFPTDKSIQQSYFKCYIGFYKETISMYGKLFWENEDEEEAYEDEDNDRPYSLKPDKEEYSLNDEIVLSDVEFTDEEKKLITSKNTCLYLLWGRYYDSMLEYVYSQNMENYGAYQSIKDKNVCFNAQQFPELKDLIDCGYAEIKYIEGTQEKTINTCYPIPNDKMPQKLMKYFKGSLIVQLEKAYLPSIFGIYEEDDDERRRLAVTGTFQITVENKNGKKVQYISGQSEMKILSEGGESNQSNQPNKSIFLKFNIILLSLILLGF